MIKRADAVVSRRHQNRLKLRALNMLRDASSGRLLRKTRVFTAMNAWCSFTVQRAFSKWSECYRKRVMIREALLAKMLRKPQAIKLLMMIGADVSKRVENGIEE